jgi:predicted dehydrogenase
MRIGVTGLGSMGRRRVRDLVGLGHEVIGFDLREDRRHAASKQFGIDVVSSWDALTERSLDALVVSTPPDAHVEYYERAFDARLPFFSEANVLTPSTDWFASRERESGVRGYASATWRFHPLLSELRSQVLAAGPERALSVHHHYAGWLPAWHPYERYDEFYAGANRATCAAREMVPFELEWIVWAFGPVRAVSGLRERRAEWTTDIDDTYLLLLEFDTGVTGTLNIELDQPAPFRRSRVTFAGCSLDLDLGAGSLRRFELEPEEWTAVGPASVDLEDVYAAEIGAFAEAVANGASEYPKTWADDRHLSDVLVAAEESARRRAWVTIAEVAESYDGILAVERA